MTTTATQLAQAYDSFGADLLRQLYAPRPDKNTIIAPVSLVGALLLAYHGAQGETAEAIAAALRLPADLGRAAIPAAVAAIQRQLTQLDRDTADEMMFGRRVSIPDDFKVWYQEARGIWMARGVPLREEYLSQARAEGTRVDSVTDAEAINGWVSEQTYGRIANLLDEIEPLTSYLVSAAYFKGGWAHLFPVAKTAPAPFHLPGGATRPVPMMELYEELPYDEDERGQYIALPLGKANVNAAESYLIIALPRPEVGLAELLAGATQGWWALRYATLISHRAGYKGTIRLPRFRARYDGRLAAALRAMGMGLAFEDNADFGALTPVRSKISQVLHSTFLAVNEEGVEAAAATAVKMAHFGISRDTPFEMTVDRPFLFAIRAARPGAMLFMGAVCDPEPLP